MLTVKFMKYSKPTYSGGQAAPGDPPIPSTRDPGYTTHVAIHPANEVYVELDKHGRQVIGIRDEKTTELVYFTIGDAERNDVMFNCAYIMNSQGRTVETIR